MCWASNLLWSGDCRLLMRLLQDECEDVRAVIEVWGEASAVEMTRYKSIVSSVYDSMIAYSVP